MDTNTTKKKVKYEGEINLAGFKIPCYVLEDGTRVLSGRGIQDVLKIYEVEEGKEKAGSRLKEFLGQKALEPFIHKEKKPAEKSSDIFEPIICYKGGTIIHGYVANLLPEMCSIFLKVRKETLKKGKSLSLRWEIVTDWAEVLLGILAKVSLDALIDEATGYEKVRKETLQELLKKYVSEDVLKWQKTFDNGFYRQIFRLWNWDPTPETMNKKPRFVAILTIKLIYENLPEGVLEKIREKTPKTKGGHWRYRFHQSLTPEVGREHLKKVIYTVEALAKVSKNKNMFLRLVKEMYHPTKDLPYIDIEAMDDEKETKFDKVMEVITKIPPTKKKKK